MRVSLLGGIGNQMFQYATALNLSIKFETDLQLDLDEFDDPGNIRMYSLGLFDVREPIVYGTTGRVIFEIRSEYNPDAFAFVNKDTTIRGYWQSEEYFKDIKSRLKEIFYPKQRTTPHYEDMACQILRSRSVFVTVRRTDYINNGVHFNLGMDYYLRAANVIASRVSDPVFFIFSDEPEWCRENFKLPYQTVIAGTHDRTVLGHLGREDEDLHLMSMCQHAIMANSSYSWWGAWLGADTKDGIVIAPKNWYTEKSRLSAATTVPQRWKRI